jgi:hypothetical protein
VTTQLIWNICKRLGQGKELPGWQARKLGELDALTKDAVKIISNTTGKAQRTIKSTLAKALGIELKDVEAILKGAVAAGAIPDIGFTIEQSQGLKALLQALSDQAVEKTNLVNTVMLNSTRQRYVWAVNNTVQEEQKLIQKLYSARDYDELEQQTAKVQKALNKATATVEAGAEARVQALSRTVKELAQEGITGYIDKGGHHWSPEAYINMDIRTTVHNAAIQAQQTRAEEYGVETFQISSHAGARPLCAPYQGKFYSWDGSSGVLHDLYGKEYYYESIGNTSYGEPAGIFGINCGHDPITFVDGYNIPRYEETKDAEANAAEYRESQKQRYFEREVRQAKLEAIAQDAAGNKDAFNQAAAKVRQANANYKEFCKETGRTPRPDRLQVYTSEQGNGYNRSMSGKVTGATRGFTPTPLKNVAQQATSTKAQQVKVEPKKPELMFKQAKTTKEAEDFAKSFMGKNVTYANMKVDRANEINEAFVYLHNNYPDVVYQDIVASRKGQCVMSSNYRVLNINTNKIGKTLNECETDFALNQSWFRAELKATKEALDTGIRYGRKISPDERRRYEQAIPALEAKLKYTRWGVGTTSGIRGTVYHEFGHALADQHIGMSNTQNPVVMSKGYGWDKLNALRQEWREVYNRAKDSGDIYKVSMYSATNEKEFFAETFAGINLGETYPDYIMEGLRRVIEFGVS